MTGKLGGSAVENGQHQTYVVDGNGHLNVCLLLNSPQNRNINLPTARDRTVKALPVSKTRVLDSRIREKNAI